MIKIILIPKEQYLESFNSNFDFGKLEVLATIEDVKINDILKIKNSYYHVSCLFRSQEVASVYKIYPNFNVNHTTTSDTFICPFCGVSYHDDSEFTDLGGKYKCYLCGSMINYKREVKITYTTKVIKQPNVTVIE